MTWRAMLIGLVLGLGVSAFTYFNDQVIVQTLLIANHLPMGVFGIVLLLLLALNPVLGSVSPRWPLRPGEIALITAMGLAVCAWPGSNLLRYFTGVVSLPHHYLTQRPAWQAQNVMSYMPGGSPLLAEGYVQDPEALVNRLVEAHQADPTPQTPEGRLVQMFPDQGRLLLSQIAADEQRAVEKRELRGLIHEINRVLPQPDFYDAQAFAEVELPESTRELLDRLRGEGEPLSQREVELLNRQLIGAAFGQVIRAPPEGEGLLLNAGYPDPQVVEQLRLGAPQGTQMNPWDLPWREWWPVLRLWCGLALLLGLASLCLTMIVHPQWSQREMLLYPTVTFVREVAERDEDRWLPNITRNRLFWIGVVGVFVMHFATGMNRWFPEFPPIPRWFDLTPLQSIFPNASRVPGSWNAFRPHIYPAVLGFGFFITTRVAMSLGLSLYLFLFLGSVMLSLGIPVESGHWNIGANTTAMRFGSYVAATIMIFYFGRRYYTRIAGCAIGLPRTAETPAYAVWAARGLVLCFLLCVALLVQYGGLSVLMSVLFVVMMLIIYLVLTRLNVETGLFYAQPDFLPSILIAGIFGLQGVGPEAYVVLSLASIIIVADPREALMPYLANGLRMSEDLADARPRRAAPVLAAMVVIGLVVALMVTLTIQYNIGVRMGDYWANNMLPRATFDNLAQITSELSSFDALHEVTGISGLEHFEHMRPDRTVLGWMAGGAIAFLLCAAARLRLPWWPIHPILFLVWGTYPANNFAFSFLLAGLIKWAVVRVGGEVSYRKVKPLMVGLIAGDLLSGVFWSGVGTAYYLNTGLTPTGYNMLP